LLQTLIEAAGHKCYFLPKFHCELNPIEMQWGWAKGRESATSDFLRKMEGLGHVLK
jgi:transposase